MFLDEIDNLEYMPVKNTKSIPSIVWCHCPVIHLKQQLFLTGFYTIGADINMAGKRVNKIFVLGEQL